VISIKESWIRIRSLARRRSIERGLDDEIRFHVDQQIEKHQRAGMPPDEARRQALVSFGGAQPEVVAAVLLYRVLTFVPPIATGGVCLLVWRRLDGAEPAPPSSG